MINSLAEALAWTVIQSLWHGAIAALLLVGCLLSFRSARIRYGCACAAMFGCLGLFTIGFCRQIIEPDAPASHQAASTVRSNLTESESAPQAGERIDWESILPWIAKFWLVGVLAFQARIALSWRTLYRLRRRGSCCASHEWQNALQRLQARLGITRSVELLESSLVDVPMVLGFWRPVILIPVGMLTGMPATLVEAILLHELAHIRRHDYLVNVLQTITESLLFYHPAIWWMSGIIRAERENCCDDLVVTSDISVSDYVSALVVLEQSRSVAPEQALAANGGNLMKRINRLLNTPKHALPPSVFAVSVIAILAGSTLLAWQAEGPSGDQQPAAYTKWLQEDVAYIIHDSERLVFRTLKTDGERQAFVERFWLRRDPVPDTPGNEFKEEHYRRLRYANERFASSISGWKTDRGRIYVVFGPPGEIESHPQGRRARDNRPAVDHPIEYWRYRHIDGIGDGIIFTFVDTNKSGDFQLTDEAGGETRFVRRP